MGAILIVVQVIIAVALILFVLLQRSDNDGFGMGSGGGTGLISGRAKANFMTRTTAILAAAFMFNSLLLAYVSSKNLNNSLIDNIAVEAEEKSQNAEKIEELTAPLADDSAPDEVKILESDKSSEIKDNIEDITAPKAE